MRVLFIVFAIFFTLSLKAQNKIVLGNPQTVIKSDKYKVMAIIDSTGAENLGRIFNSGSTKGPLELNYTSLNRYIAKSFSSQSVGRDVSIVLKNLEFSENMGEKYLVNGGLKLQVDFYIHYDSDTILLYQAKGGSKYQRSISFGYEERLGELITQSLNSSFENFDKYVNENYLKLECFNKGSLVEIKPYRTGSSSDTLFYNNGKLSWTNFKAEPRSTSRFSAAIFPSFNIRSTYVMENGFLKATIYPSVYMVENMSWVKQDAINSYSLGHEKLHFDITYLAAQRLLKVLQNVKANTVRDLQSFIQYEYLEAFRYMNRMQDLYDEETKHGINEDAQIQWAARIKSELAAIQ
ncbi:hypothetical protein SAMN06298216_3263 [Spirosomataceae bacterium TFI 002]|nr:hypothetical protein SAMN06298216_3263 [Spirosomataceae bacterium TFI 002]